MIYSFSQWLFFFYIYCFIGWIWETCYVSVLQGKWVNRGFMRGPFLPIYGSGAIIVLIFTLPFRTDAVAVYFIGMISATILEYCTGVVMEKLFHVRYWDYSNQPFNLKGHICLTSSLAWGAFSVILTLYGHNPIERFVLRMNDNFVEFLVFILTVVISIDMFESVREALNLKEMLLSLEENNAEFRRIQKHIEVIQAFYGTELKEKSEVGLKKLSTAIESGKEFYNRKKEHKKRKSATKAVFIANLERTRTVKEETLKRLSDTMEAYAERLKGIAEKDESILQAISESRSIVSKQKHNILSMKNKEYIRLRALLKRNPHAVSKMHEQAFSEIMEITEESENEIKEAE